MTQREITPRHQLKKDEILLEDRRLSGKLQSAIGRLFAYYNHKRDRQTLANPTPTDVCHGRRTTSRRMRRKIQQQTLSQRRWACRRHEVA